MPDKVSCIHCDRSYEVDLSKGTSIRCFCGKLIRFSERPSQPPDSHIRFSCPSCSKPYKVLAEKAGQERICPSCSTPFTIPSHSTPTPNQVHHQQEPKLINCSDCDTIISRRALVCPKCGAPQTAAQAAAKAEKAAMMAPYIVVFGAIFGFLFVVIFVMGMPLLTIRPR